VRAAAGRARARRAVAGALGLGVCAIGALYDDEAAALFGADPARGWVVYAAEVGRLT
jgi:hypothetical protein